jgi:hypothetical protein
LILAYFILVTTTGWLSVNLSQGTFIYRTNLGETVNKGIEGFVNLNARLFDVDALYGNLDVLQR